MNNDISSTELKKIPYIKSNLNLNGLFFHMIPFWDGSEWHQWGPSSEGRLIQLNIADAYQALYVAKDIPAKSTDIEILFISLMWQRVRDREIYKKVTAIIQDFSNMAVSLAKIEHIFNTKDSIKNGSAGGFVATEIEYLLVLSRSVFDLLYEVLLPLWNSTRLFDNEGNLTRTTRQLPNKLSKFLFSENQPKTAQSLIGAYGIPLTLAQTMENCAPFIKYVRDARDRIVHNGDSIDIVFETEKGFCVNGSEHPFSDFYSNLDISPFKYNENGLVSLWPWLSNIVLGTIFSCNNIVAAFSKQIQLPEEIAPGYKVFLRDPSNRSLARVSEVSRGGYPWWDTPPASH